MIFSTSSKRQDDVELPRLHSPPHDWPQCFHDKHLAAFLKRLKASRARIVQTPDTKLCNRTEPHLRDAFTPKQKAHALSEALGWDVLHGFAVYQLPAAAADGEDTPVYAAAEHWWNAAGKTWVDAAPRAPSHENVLLVESALSPTEQPPHTAAVWRPAEPTAPPQSLAMLNPSEKWRRLCADASFLDEISGLRSKADLFTYLRDLKESGQSERLALIQANPRSFASLLEEVPAGGRPRGGGGVDARPRASSVGSGSSSDTEATESSTAVLPRSSKHSADREAEMRAARAGVWSCFKGAKAKHGRVRLLLRSEVLDEDREMAADSAPPSPVGSFQLECASWSSLYDESDVPAALFAPLDEDDESAAQMRCSGVWESTPYGFTLYVRDALELGPPAELSLRASEVLAAAGRCRELYGTMDGATGRVVVGVAIALTASAHEWAPATVDEPSLRDLHREYGNIFTRGNRNAASHLWASFLLDRASSMSLERLQFFFTGFCAVSGSPVNPGRYSRYRLTLPAAFGGKVRGYLYYCCWPCVCDTHDFIRVDTKTVRTADGEHRLHVAVIGDPCTHPEALETRFFQPFGRGETTLAREAPEVRCKDGKLDGATFSDHGHVILTVFPLADGDDDAMGALVQPKPGRVRTSSSGFTFQDEYEFSQMCADRAEAGYNSGMGEIFRKVAEIHTVKPVQAEPTHALAAPGATTEVIESETESTGGFCG